jgi:hypothetical protein
MTVTMMRPRYESKSQRLTVVDYVGIACVRKCQAWGQVEWLTLIQEHFFPAIVKRLLRILVLFALEDGCERGNVLYHAPQRPVRINAC